MSTPLTQALSGASSVIPGSTGVVGEAMRRNPSGASRMAGFMPWGVKGAYAIKRIVDNPNINGVIDAITTGSVPTMLADFALKSTTGRNMRETFTEGMADVNRLNKSAGYDGFNAPPMPF